jgi:hypothetical protein
MKKGNILVAPYQQIVCTVPASELVSDVAVLTHLTIQKGEPLFDVE